MDINGLHLSLGGLAFLVSLIGGLGSIYRFMIRPALDASAKEQADTRRWRNNAETRLALIEASLDPDAVAKVSELRAALLKD